MSIRLGAESAIIGIALVVAALAMPGCAGGNFAVKNLAKTDVDLVADAHYQTSQQLLRDLTVKLYRRNPRELAKTPGATVEQRVEQLFASPGVQQPAELQGARGVAAMELASDPGYTGDRVFATIFGLNTMLREAYGGKSEFFIFDELDQQKLYHSARNIEILVWRLNTRRDGRGKPLLLTNSLPGEPPNLSFERRFGKLISIQDMLARIIAQKQKRLINVVTHTLASMAFIPL